MFRNFYTMITTFPKKTPVEIFKPLHRWNIDYSHKNMNRKIDLANEDHCGPCGQYALIKTNKIKKINEFSNVENFNYSPFRVSNIDFLVHYEEEKPKKFIYNKH